MKAALEGPWGNPSSIHREGRAARDLLEGARRQVAALVGGDPDEIVFTSGGTEADWLGISGLQQLAGGPVACAAIEHPAALGPAADAIPIEVDADGRIDVAAVEAACRAGARVVVVGMANHELGTLQDVAELVAVAHEHKARVHCDAVQAAGKVPIDARSLEVDTLAISSHKIYGPKGTGALWIRRDVDLPPLVEAGHQERGRRPGTENLLGAVGFGAAAEVAERVGLVQAPEVARLTARLEAGLVDIPGARIHGAGAVRVGNTINVGFEGALGEVVVAALDLEGIACSTGAACTSGTVKASAVLLAVGLDEDRAKEAIRFSLGRQNSEDEVKALLELLPSIIARARAFR
jgi:cysteine desulfurase